MSYQPLPRFSAEPRPMLGSFRHWRPLIWLLVLGLVLISASLLSCRGQPEEGNQLKLVFADASTVWWTAPTILARTEGLFDANLEVTTFDVTTGLASKNAVVAGNADIGLVASTPLALGRYSQEDIVVLCSYVKSDKLLALIAPQGEPVTIEGLSPIAVVPGTISQFYLFRYLESEGIDDLAELSELHGRPPDIPNMLLTGSASSAVIWEPLVSVIDDRARAEGKDLEFLRKGEIYELRLYLVTRPDVLADPDKKAAIAAFLRGVQSASKLFENSTGRAKLESHFGYSDGWLSPIIEDVSFGVRTDFERMAMLIAEESELAIRAGVIEGVEPLEAKSLRDLFADPAWVKTVIGAE